MLARIVDTIFCGTAFWVGKKENCLKKSFDTNSRMRTHQCRPITLLFYANCINLPGLAGKIGDNFKIFSDSDRLAGDHRPDRMSFQGQYSL